MKYEKLTGPSRGLQRTSHTNLVALSTEEKKINVQKCPLKQNSFFGMTFPILLSHNDTLYNRKAKQRIRVFWHIVIWLSTLYIIY